MALALSGKDKEVTYGKVTNLLCALADWDGKSRRDDLKNLTRQLNENFSLLDGHFDSHDQMNVTLYRKRIASGDPTALQDYADWLLSLSPKKDDQWIFVLPVMCRALR